MVTNVQQRTASECSLELLDALNHGSEERVRRALDAIVSLSSAGTPDARESEFRDLLAGIAEPIARSMPEFRSARNSSAQAISVQMLKHVATVAGLTGIAG